jgi:hypothetical protein
LLRRRHEQVVGKADVDVSGLGIYAGATMPIAGLTTEGAYVSATTWH